MHYMAKVYKAELGSHVSAALPKLWAAIDARGWTQADLASAVGAGQSVVNRWLHGHVKPNRKFSRIIERIVGVPQEDWDRAPRRPFSLVKSPTKAAP